MVKKQRGKTASLSKTTIVEKTKDNLNLLLSSSDDEAPEEVTFEDSKAQALHNMKEALDSVRREKELLKEKRRKRQQLFQEQKKRKLLPADVLEELDLAPPEKQKDSSDEAAEKEDEEHTKNEDDRKKNQKKNAKTIDGSNTVMTVKQCGSACSQQEAAEDFLRSRLYGPGSRRTTSNELLSLQNKRSRIKSAAVQFERKDWACQQKAKAEKLKKRWIHRQRNPS